LALSVSCEPLIKVFCQGQPLFRGRVDSLVEPGIVSNHVHRIAGGSKFEVGSPQVDEVQVYKTLFNSNCTSCSLQKVDLSAYWHPDLYYQWPNGTFQLVPDGGLTVYYLFRSGDGNQSKPAWTAFPPGFRMTSGTYNRRSYNETIMSNRAVSYACLSDGGGPETPGFPTATRFCVNGLRLQVHFPQCWDGKNLDSPTHQTHVAYPIERPDGGNCPPTHPVRLPNLFFEAFYSVSQFPHGTGRQPFVLGNGDPTGFGFHGDFLNGWDQKVLQSVVTDPSCDSTNTANGNDVKACKPLTAYVSAPGPGECQLETKVPLTEDLGSGHVISRLPGCNPLTPGPQPAVPCSAPPSQSDSPGVNVRFHLRSKKTNKYLSCPQLHSLPLVASATVLSLTEVFTVQNVNGGVTMRDEYSLQFLSANGDNGVVFCDRPSASSWETFSIIPQSGTYVAIKSLRNGNYLSVQADGTVAPISSTIGDAELFDRTTPTGGSVF